MFPRERLRLLWILLLVPMLGVLGLDLHRLHHPREETIERAVPVTPQAFRRETGQLNPGQAGKHSPERYAALPLQFGVALFGPRAADVAPPVPLVWWVRDIATASPWQARGPPIGA